MCTRMNRFFTLLFAASCLTAVGQVTWYNPDGNADTLQVRQTCKTCFPVYGILSCRQKFSLGTVLFSWIPIVVRMQQATIESLVDQLGSIAKRRVVSIVAPIN